MATLRVLSLRARSSLPKRNCRLKAVERAGIAEHTDESRQARCLQGWGDVSRLTLYATAIGQERTVLLRLRGRDLLAALESGFSRLADGAERFPQLSGLSVVVDPTRPIGRRITSALVGNTPLDPERWYTLATTSALAAGGEGYDALADAERLIDERAAGVTAVQLFDRIAAQGVIAPAIEGRITLR